MPMLDSAAKGEIPGIDPNVAQAQNKSRWRPPL